MLKGNAIVGQSGGPTSVINASLVGVFKTAKDEGCGTVYGMRNGIEGFLAENLINLSERFANEDELIEVTPKSIRLRKKILNTELRLKEMAKKK